MKRSLIASIPVIVLGLSGCGGARLAPGKQNAANALYMTTNGTGAATGSPYLQPLYRLAIQNVTTGADVTVNCPHGGRATVHYTVDTTSTTAQVSFDLQYAGCNYDGHTAMNGTMGFHEAVNTTATSAQVGLQMNGKANFSGAIGDFISADVTENVVASSGTSGSASVALNGTVTDSSGTYTFNNESFTVGPPQSAP